MTDATTSPVSPELLSGMSGGLSILGSMYGGIVKSQEAKAQARMIENKMKETKFRAMQNINLISRQHQTILGRQKAVAASQGKVGGRGSNYLLLEDTMSKMGEVMSDYTRDVAWQMYDMKYQSEMSKMQAKNAMTAALINSMSTVASTAYDIIKNPNKPGTATEVDENENPTGEVNYGKVSDDRYLSPALRDIYKKGQLKFNYGR